MFKGVVFKRGASMYASMGWIGWWIGWWKEHADCTQSGQDRLVDEVDDEIGEQIRLNNFIVWVWLIAR